MSPAPPVAAAVGLPPLRDVVARHGLMARKSLGQHFLFDLNLTRRIAAAAGDLSAGTTIEVGPGPGGLTRALLEAGAGKVVAIERDPRFVPALEEIAAIHPGRLTIVVGDALAVDAASLGPPPRRVVANLPYNVGTPLLLGWLGRPDVFVSLTVMLQKEVVERIAAAPATRPTDVCRSPRNGAGPRGAFSTCLRPRSSRRRRSFPPWPASFRAKPRSRRPIRTAWNG